MTADRITGATIRWSYRDGPTKGTTFEHHFDPDGTVTYRMLDGKPSSGAGNGKSASERQTYQVAAACDEVSVVTYLAPSGWTLTSILDFDAGTIVSVASNEKQVFVQRGTFEIVAAPARGSSL